jgi:hypothetical protein
VFGAGSVKEVYPEWWTTNAAPGTTDMTLALKAAQGSILSGGVIQLASTSYLISDSIPLIDNQILRGNGAVSIITSAMNEDFITITGAGGQGANIEYLKLFSTSNAFTHYHIHGIGTAIAPLDKPTFFNVEMHATDAATGGGIFMDDQSAAGNTSFLATVDHCWIRGGKILMNFNDSRITNSIIWSVDRDLAIQGYYNNLIITGNEIACGSACGILLTYHADGSNNLVLIANNYLGGNWVPDATGPCIVGIGYRNVNVIGNQFLWCRGAIDITACNNWLIEGNLFVNTNYNNDNADTIKITGILDSGNNNTISGNIFDNSTVLTNLGYAINEVNGGTQPVLNSFYNNQIIGYFAAKSINYDRSGNGSNRSKIWGNKLSYIDYAYRENSLALTVDVTQTFAYGSVLPYVPKASDFNINFTGTPPPTWALTNIGDTYFDINFASAPVITTTLNWSVDIK